ncbi:ABC transporter permease [Kineococcus sp. R86509]|uniref:ABC transporter permease n=1 Tax=Kineococcus sp. R86509 TaxID=3093851 RepID=UPI0036D35660
MATTTTGAPAGTEVHENRSNASVASAVGKRIGISVLTLVISAVVLVIAWYALLRILAIDEFVGKRPLDVYQWLFADDKAAANRSDMWGWLKVTLTDSITGFLAGVVGAIVVASLFTVIRPLEFVFMPLAMMLRSVPLVAMAPIIGMTFHSELLRAATIGGVVVFFPVLVNAAIGLRSASPQAIDVIRVNGGTKWTALRLVAVPTALPNLFAAIRISVPGAVIGAMLYEWLFSGTGLGSEIFRANANVQYNKLWSIVVVVTFTSILLYTVVSIVETLVLAKWGPNAGRR